MSKGSLSIWERTCALPSRSPLDRDMEIDVCVVGAGITGLTTAYLLAKAGKKVIVLDDGNVGSGESHRTTGHLSSVLGDRYTWFEKVHGKKRAKLIAESNMASISMIEKIVKDEKIGCEFERLSGYLFVEKGESDAELKEEKVCAKRLGMNVELHDTAPLPEWKTGTSLEWKDQGQFHMMKYLTGLLKAVEKLGGTIFTGTHVSKVHGGSPSSVETTDGKTVKANSVVIATNAPICDNALIYGRQAPFRTYVLSAQIPKGYVQKGLYWDTAFPYHYVRLEHGDAHHDVLISGGEDHRTAQADDFEKRFESLEDWTRAHFPKMGAVIDTWSGQVLASHDGIAMIGKCPDLRKNVYIATGDSGNGITHGTIASMLLCDMICGKKNPWEDVYKPLRIRVGALGHLSKDGFDTAKGAMCGFVNFGNTPDEKIEKGEGAVVTRGIRKIALYRDTDGAMHSFSAICPHRGCIIKWNAFEKSFDCPCHGSRFDSNGTALNGPTIRPLKKVRK